MVRNMKATYRKLQIVSQDRMSVLEYGGVKVRKDRDNGYTICAIEHGALYPVGKYYSMEKVQAILSEVLYYASSGKTHYYMPAD